MVEMWFGDGGGTPSIMAEMETEMGKKSIIENRLLEKPWQRTWQRDFGRNMGL